jgi:hypothetical protein
LTARIGIFKKETLESSALCYDPGKRSPQQILAAHNSSFRDRPAAWPGAAMGD